MSVLALLSEKRESIKIPPVSSTVDVRPQSLLSDRKNEKRQELSASQGYILPAYVFISVTAPVYYSPVRVDNGRLVVDVDFMKSGVYYYVEHEGVPQLIMKTADGKLEFYEIIGTSKDEK